MHVFSRLLLLQCLAEHTDDAPDKDPVPPHPCSANCTKNRGHYKHLKRIEPPEKAAARHLVVYGTEYEASYT